MDFVLCAQYMCVVITMRRRRSCICMAWHVILWNQNGTDGERREKKTSGKEKTNEK